MVGRSACPCSRSSKAMATIAPIRSLLIEAAERRHCQKTDPDSVRARRRSLLPVRQWCGWSSRLVCPVPRRSAGEAQRVPEICRRSTEPERKCSARFHRSSPRLCVARGVWATDNTDLTPICARALRDPSPPLMQTAQSWCAIRGSVRLQDLDSTSRGAGCLLQQEHGIWQIVGKPSLSDRLVEIVLSPSGGVRVWRRCRPDE
jgi:hypothetical protein